MNRYPSHRTEQTSRPSPMERLRRAAGTRAGKIALGVTLGLGILGGAFRGAHEVHERNAAEYEATQEKIAPIIRDTMVDINRQTLEQLRENPDSITRVDNPNDGDGVAEFMTNTANVTVVMGETEDGQLDPADPRYINYRNNVATGPGTRGYQIILTSPEGNDHVDRETGFGGSTEGGWGAAVPGSCDTTSRGYAGTSMPEPLEAAQQVADMVERFGPYDPYPLSRQ